MIQYEKISTVHTTNTSLPTLVQSEDALAFATFPEFQSVIHPDYVFQSNLSALDRANGLLCDNLIGTEIVTGTFPNGAPAFDIKATVEPSGTTNGRALSATAITFAEFSYVVAINIVHGGVSAAAGLSLLGRSTEPRALINTTNRFQFWDNTGAFLADPTALADGITSVYIFTYSDGNGGKLFKNGELISSNSSNLVRSVESLKLDTLYGSTYLNTATSALQSGHYVTGIDLSKPEHAAKLAAMTKYMVNKYIN